jgi:glycosyltransferase involved in cell wall biosynthesis
MRILYIITQADGGGAQQYVLQLARHFNGAIVAGREGRKLFADAQASGLTVFPLKHLKRNIDPWHDLLAIWEIRNLIKIYQPDIVHLNSTKAGVLGSFAAIGLKTKIIYTAHGFIFNEPLPYLFKTFYLALEKIASDFRDMIIAVSDADRNSALAYRLIAPHKIITVHNGIGPIDFTDGLTAKQELKLPVDKFLSVTVANFYKTKGIDVLIQAVNLLPDDLKAKSQFVLIGDGPENKTLRFKIKDLRLENSFILLGKINNMKRYLRAFDCFVLPSHKEGFPFAVLEALQANLPIVASDTGGVKEALGDGGILVPPENPGALSQAIATIILDSNIAAELSRKAATRARLFTEQKMLEETERIYRAILN